MSISKQNLYGLLSPLPVYTVPKSKFFELGQFQQSYQQSFDNFSKYVHCMFIFISLIRKVLGSISIALPVLFPLNFIHNYLGIFWAHLNSLASFISSKFYSQLITLAFFGSISMALLASLSASSHFFMLK